MDRLEHLRAVVAARGQERVREEDQVVQRAGIMAYV